MRNQNNTVVQESAASHQRKNRSQVLEVWGRLKKQPAAVIGAVVFAAILILALAAPVIVDYETDVIGQNAPERLQGPSLNHLCGTDEMGRDILSRIIYGARYSLKVGILATVISALIGIPAGAVAGYFGGAVDNIIMRICDIIGGIPSILLAMCIVAALGTGDTNLVIAIGFASVNVYTRVTRAAVLSVSGSEFVEAARAVGESEAEIIVKHILPNCLSPIIVQTTLRVATSIIRASSLSFIGLGIAPPSPEWGAMLTAGRTYLRGHAYMTIFPGLAIMITVLSLNLLGDGLRDAMDPKQK